MLRELFIRNLAIIEEARIEFGPGLNVLTGETGAGKSLLVGALELILGERAKGEWIRSGSDEARVEALFDIETVQEIPSVLEDAGYPSEDTLVVRRTVNRFGKNRIYVNDRAATLGFLETLGQKLVDIHGQHEHQSLLRINRHRELLDLFGDLVSRREHVTSLYRSLRTLHEQRRRLQEEYERMTSEKDMAVYQCDEISKANVRPGEDEELEQERQKLLHSEKLRGVCQQIEETLYGDERSVVDTVGHLQKRLEEASRVDPQLMEVAQQLETALHHLEETAQQVQRYADTIEGDPHRLDQVEARLAELHRLKRKYNRSLTEVLELGEELRAKVRKMEHFDDERKVLEEDMLRTESVLIEAASALSQARKKTARKLEAGVGRELRAIGMQEARFQADVQSGQPHRGEKHPDGVDLKGRHIHPWGMDQIEFLIRPNPGQDFKPLRRIASGGELSRIMLAMRNVLRRSDNLPVLVFDEVDAGIGGAEAEAVGKRLKALSRDFQLLCITHLPQIAVYGDRHLKVSKQFEENQTRFRIQSLTKKDREKEIARMLGGARITDKTLAHAREMLKMGAEKEPS